MARRLSKSRYTQFRLCDKALWLGVFKPEEAVIDDATKERFAAGTEIGEVAKGLLGDYEDILTLAVQNDYFLLVTIYQVVIICGKVFWVNRSTFSYLCKYVCTQKEEPFRQHQRGGDRQEFGQTKGTCLHRRVL